MTIDEIIALYDEWQKRKKVVEDNEELLDVENSLPDRAQYEMLIEARSKSFTKFDRAFKDALKPIQQEVRSTILGRRKA
jgi:hypothetical protein